MSRRQPKKGQQWKAVINGRKALNGGRYSVSTEGKITAADATATIYDCLRDLADYLESDNPEMTLPDSIEVTIYPVDQPKS